MRYERLTTAEQQATVLQGLKNLEAQHLQACMDVEGNRAAGQEVAAAEREKAAQALAAAIGAIRKQWQGLLAFKLPTPEPKGDGDGKVPQPKLVGAKR